MYGLVIELLMSLQDKVALLASNGRFISAPEDGGRVYCLSEKAGEREMIQVGCSNIVYSFFSENMFTLRVLEIFN